MNEKAHKTKTYFETREEKLMASKLAVARHVVTRFLREGDSILLDAGTSSYPIAEEIANRARQDPASTHYTIMTHNYKAFQILIEKVPREAMVNIVLAGGRYDRDLNALFGPQTIMAYDDFYPRIVILAVSAMVANRGLFCHGNTEELAVKQRIFNKEARDRIVIADHTKFGVPDALCFGKTDDLLANVENCFIVTDEPSKESDKVLRDRFAKERACLTKEHKVIVEVVQVLDPPGTSEETS